MDLSILAMQKLYIVGWRLMGTVRISLTKWGPSGSLLLNATVLALEQ